MNALRKFQPSSAAETGQRPDAGRLESNHAAEELIRLASDVVAGLADIPNGLAILEAKVTEVADAMKPGQPLREALDALDALLAQKIRW